MIRTFTEILKTEVLYKLDEKIGRDGYVSLLETGCIRTDSDAGRIGDGWSTLLLATMVRAHSGNGRVDSIDLDTSVARQVIAREGLSHVVSFHNEHSIRALAREVAIGARFDMVLLDSANDGDLILHEFYLAQFLVKPGGYIVVDDVRMDHHKTGEPAKAKKGDRVLPLVREHGWAHALFERQGWGEYRCGVLVIEVPERWYS